jgi:hypothetical protein
MFAVAGARGVPGRMHALGSIKPMTGMRPLPPIPANAAVLESRLRVG